MDPTRPMRTEVIDTSQPMETAETRNPLNSLYFCSMIPWITVILEFEYICTLSFAVPDRYRTGSRCKLFEFSIRLKTGLKYYR